MPHFFSSHLSRKIKYAIYSFQIHFWLIHHAPRYSELTKRCESETSSPVQRDTGGSCLDAQVCAAGSSLHSSHIGIIYAYSIYYIYIYTYIILYYIILYYIILYYIILYYIILYYIIYINIYIIIYIYILYYIYDIIYNIYI